MSQEKVGPPTDPSTWKLVPFETVSEEWNEYNLPDGSVLQLKTILLKVMDMRIKSPATGEPAYHFQTKVVGRVFTEKQGYVRRRR